MSDDQGDIIIDGAWMTSGWQFLLPQQSSALHALVATATDRKLDGPLDALVDAFGGTWFDYFTGGLDCTVRWIHPEPEDRRERRWGRTARRECLVAFLAAGRQMPATVRKLASTMADLGIFEADLAVPRWRTVRWPPLPDEVLPVSECFRAAEAWRRWSELHDSAAFRIARLLAASRPHGELVLTSIEELQTATGYTDLTIRAGLEVLTRDKAAILRLPNGDPADAEQLPTWVPFLVDLHLEAFGASRLDR